LAKKPTCRLFDATVPCFRRAWKRLLVYALYVEDRCANMDNLPITMAGTNNRHSTHSLSPDHDGAPFAWLLSCRDPQPWVGYYVQLGSTVQNTRYTVTCPLARGYVNCFGKVPPTRPSLAIGAHQCLAFPTRGMSMRCHGLGISPTGISIRVGPSSWSNPWRIADARASGVSTRRPCAP
jgi:hypothetical protein